MQKWDESAVDVLLQELTKMEDKEQLRYRHHYRHHSHDCDPFFQTRMVLMCIARTKGNKAYALTSQSEVRGGGGGRGGRTNAESIFVVNKRMYLRALSSLDLHVI